jgi:DNA (cytosine-5)-methyltransferase 1
VCSGIEAASVAWYPLGWKAAWLSEIDKSASAVLAYRFPDVPNLGDMTTIATQIDIGAVEAPDALVGGTPCQGFSVAGRRGSLSDPRGRLTLSFVEIADAIDRVRRAAGKPECVITWENVPGVLSLKDNAFGHFLAALAGEDLPLKPSGKRWADAGVVVGPKRTVAWRLLDAQFFGLAQRRKRVFVVASARDGFDPGEVLLEFDGVRRDSPPSREKRETVTHDVAPCLTGSGRGIERTGDTRGQDPVVAVGHRITNRVSPVAFGGGNCSGPIAAAAAAALNASERYDFDSETFLVEAQCVTGDITHTLKAEGFDASEDGTGRGQPIVPFSIMPMNSGKDYKARQTDIAQPLMAGGPVGGNQGGDYIVQPIAFSAKDHGADCTEGLSPTLRAGGHSESHANGGVMPAVAYAIQERAVCENPDAGPDGIGVRTDDCAYTLEARTVPQAVGFVQNSRSEVRLMGGDGQVAGALAAEAGAQQQTYIANNMAVRRLMPVECERLQGFPDDWTRIPVRFYRTYQPSALRPPDMWEVGFGPNNQPGYWLMSADGPRYKQLGNSMAVKLMRWIGRRIQRQLIMELIG